MMRRATLIGTWLTFVGLMCWSGMGLAEDPMPGGGVTVPPGGTTPDCMSCDCAEDIAWSYTNDTKSYVLTVYDASLPNKVGEAVTTARWKNADSGTNKVYHTACLMDNHSVGVDHRVLIFEKNWDFKCKLTGTQTDGGYIATKYDNTATYSFPMNENDRIKPRTKCSSN